MNPERWRQITELFHAARAHDALGRDAFLSEACAGDPQLRQELDSLIAAHDEATRFGDTPISLRGPLLQPGTSKGPYRVDELLGSGGMDI